MQTSLLKLTITNLFFATALASCTTAQDNVDVDTDSDVQTDGKADNADYVSGDMVHEWMILAAQLVKEEKVATPLAARVYGYVGLSVHEAAQAGRRGAANQTWATKLAGLKAIPQSGRGTHKPAIAVAQSTAAVLAELIPSPAAKLKIDALLALHMERFKTISSNSDRSIAFGKAVASALITRSKSDGFAATRNRPYTPPVGPDKWVPTGAATSPLEPFWGTIATVSSATTATTCLDFIEPPVPFSTAPNSAMYAQAMGTINAGKSNDADQDLIAFHWADSPGQTTTPPGHWIEIAAQEGARAHLSLLKAAEMHGLLGVAEMDAFITGWNIKYTYNLLRSQSYIQKYIDASWKHRLATPAFPEYISGHSIGSSAAAIVLSKVLGENHPFTDLTRVGVVVNDSGGVGRTLASRKYASFQAAADEAAMSRLFGGIHYPMGDENGLLAGTCVADVLLRAVK
jgi:hypothetical protein